MSVNTYANQTSRTSGTSTNTTAGDKYSKEQLGLLYAAGGLNLKQAKKQAKYEKQKAKLQERLSAGKMDQAKYDARLARLDEKLAQPTTKERAYEIALEGMEPVEYYPDQTYVDLDPYTTEAIEARARAASGGGVTGQAQGYVGDVLSGKYLSPETNPWLKSMYEDAASGVTSNYLNTVLPQLDARFARSGGMGGAYQGMLNASNQGLADELSGMAANLYGGAYAQERGLMDRAAGLAPTVQQMGYYDLDELERAGRTREEQKRVELAEMMDRFYHGENADFAAIDRILGRGTQVPLAAGGGTTKYGQRTIGSGSQQQPSPPEQMPLWAQFVGSVL